MEMPWKCHGKPGGKPGATEHASPLLGGTWTHVLRPCVPLNQQQPGGSWCNGMQWRQRRYFATLYDFVDNETEMDMFFPVNLNVL